MLKAKRKRKLPATLRGRGGQLVEIVRTLPEIGPWLEMSPTLEGYLEAYRRAWDEAKHLTAPTIERVALHAGRSRAATCRALDRLADRGFLQRRPYGEHGGDQYLPSPKAPKIDGIKPLIAPANAGRR